MSSNPFATRFIRPGAIPFVFPEGVSTQSLVQQLGDQGWWGQIVGPHGSGKSTLLATLAPALEAAERRVIAITMHQGEHRLPPIDQSAFAANTQLIIDGYEQLSWWPKRRVKSLCHRHRCGLLVTAHTDVGLPTLYLTQPSLQLAEAVVARLVSHSDAKISAEDISTAFAASDGNLRETLFRLFDVCQHRV
jgi:energy-coupling factor transporter ATP-binding protein EcfA2